MDEISRHELSLEQQKAVSCDSPAILVVASAGTGKTEVVARRVERLLSEGGFFRILAVSYTLKSANELEQRIASHLGDLAHRVDAKTIHGFALDLVRQHGTHLGLPVDPEILTRDEDRVELFSRWYQEQGRQIPSQLQESLERIDRARADLKDDDLLEDWKEALDSSGALDYPAMLANATQLLRLPWMHRQLKRSYGHVIVDEAQNLTAAQYEMLISMIGVPENGEHVPAMFVGDDKQSIVGFAGADARYMQEFADSYRAQRFEFDTNYRSAQRIARLGTLVARDLNRSAGIAGRRPIQTRYAAPGLVSYREFDDEGSEADYVTNWVRTLLGKGIPLDALTDGELPSVRPEEIAVLARWTASLNSTEESLLEAGFEVAKSIAAIDWMYTDTGRIVTELINVASSSGYKAARWRLAELLKIDGELPRKLESLRQLFEHHDDSSRRALTRLCEARSPHEFMHEVASIDLPPDDRDGGHPFWREDLALLQADWESFARMRPKAERTWSNFRDHIFHQRRGNESDPGIRLLTIHRAQNREYRALRI